MYRISILITCHNRRDKTLACLDALFKNKLPEGYKLDVFLVDDGSADGTRKAVSERFSDVRLIKGDGNLYWNGGMRVAWEAAITSGVTYDYFIWLNDDSHVYPDAVRKVVDSFETLVGTGETPGALVGTMVDPTSKRPTYGGRRSVSKLNPMKMSGVLSPGVDPVKCHFVNGNFTIISAKAFQAIGNLSEAYTHSMGDFDYGLRLIEAEFTCWVAQGAYGECESNSMIGGWQDNSLPLHERVKLIRSITQQPPLDEWIIFIKRHAGPFWVLYWLSATIRHKFPIYWLKIHDFKRKFR